MFLDCARHFVFINDHISESGLLDYHLQMKKKRATADFGPEKEYSLLVVRNRSSFINIMFHLNAGQ
jgi:hypothetical protein